MPLHLIRLERKERPRRPPPQCWVARLVQQNGEWRRRYVPLFRSLTHVNGRASYWTVELYFLIEEGEIHEAYEHTDVYARKVDWFFFVHDGHNIKRLTQREIQQRGIDYVRA